MPKEYLTNGARLLASVSFLVPLLLAVTFVSPQQGAQAIGVLPIEVTTTAANVDRVELSVDGVLAGVAKKPPYRIAYDFGTSLAGHEITATVFSNGYRTTETAKVLTAALSAGETMNVDLVEVPMRVRAPCQRVWERPWCARVPRHAPASDLVPARPLTVGFV